MNMNCANSANCSGGTLYKFQSKSGIGICTTLSMSDSSEETSPEYLSLDVSSYTLPLSSEMFSLSHKGTLYKSNSNHSVHASGTINLPYDSYHLLSISHTFPYLKRPQLTIALDGHTKLSCELAYPVLPEDAPTMHHNSLLSHTPFNIHIASMGLIPECPPMELLALAAEYGPSSPSILPIIPPVPCSREAVYAHTLRTGKKSRPTHGIGVPLCIQSSASMALQKWTSKVFLEYTVLNAVTGDNNSKHSQNRVWLLNRMGCELGDAPRSPKLGVVHPLPPNASAKDSNNSDNFNAVLFGSLKYTSEEHKILYLDQTWYTVNGNSCSLLPYLMAIELPLYQQTLFQNPTKDWKRQIAGELLHLLADGLRLGGILREAIVQEGLLCGLSSLLRRVLSFGEEGLVVDGAVDLISACCGGVFVARHDERYSKLDPYALTSKNANKLNSINPALYLRRTSDLALQCILSLGLDFSFWSHSPDAFCRVLEAITKRYLPIFRDFLRMHITPQHFLDLVRMHFPPNVKLKGSVYVISQSLSDVFHALLSSTVSNCMNQNIVQGEKDILITISALAEAGLGNVTSHVILTTLERLLEEGNSDEIRFLGRSMLLAEFHSIVGPMLLGRIVLGENNNTEESVTHDEKSMNSAGINVVLNVDDGIGWRKHWRTCLLLFSWLASISGKEGTLAAKSFGKLLDASADAGSLKNCMNEEFLMGKLIPKIASWERMEVLLYFMPGLITSMLRSTNDIFCEKLVHSFLLQMTNWLDRSRLDSGDGKTNSCIQRGRDFIPLFVGVVGIIRHASEILIQDSKSAKPSDGPVANQKNDDWVKVESDPKNNSKPPPPPVMMKDRLEELTKSEEVAMEAAANLVHNSMRRGGGEGSMTALQSVVRSPSRSHFQSPDDKRRFLCRLTSMVFMKITPADGPEHRRSLNSAGTTTATSWSVNTCAAIARLCDFVEEKELLENVSDPDSVVLLVSFLQVMKVGREDLGWCQLSVSSFTRPGGTDLAEFLGNDAPYLGANTVSTNSQDYHLPDMTKTTPHKYLLPILQPSLRISLSSLSHLRYNQSLPTSTFTNPQIYSHLCVELNNTITAAILGLTFSNARDVGLMSLTKLRQAIQIQSAKLEWQCMTECQELLFLCTRELRERHVRERRVRHNAEFGAYGNRHEGESVLEGESAKAVERILSGAELSLNTNHNESDNNNNSTSKDDFILFPEKLSLPKIGLGVTTLGYSNYAGLGSALDACVENNLLTPDDLDKHSRSQSILTILEKYLNVWDESATKMDEEHELVELFSESMGFDTDTDIGTNMDENDITNNTDNNNNKSGLSTSADAVAHFIELASSERSRLHELERNLLPSWKYAREAFVDALGWKHWREFALPGDDANHEWERSAMEGGRDMYSRKITQPILPQFERFIPDYLDHTVDDKSSHDDKPDHDDPIPTPNDNDAVTEKGLWDEHDENDVVNVGDMSDADLNLARMSIRNLTVVDITKLQNVDSELQALEEKSECDVDDNDNDSDGDGDGDDDGQFLGFPSSRGLNIDNDNEHATNKKLETAPITNNKSETTPTNEHKLLHSMFGTPHYSMSSFSYPPDGTILGHGGAGTNAVEMYWDNCLHVRPEGSRKGVLLLTNNHLIMEYESDLYEGEIMAIDEAKKRKEDSQRCLTPAEEKDKEKDKDEDNKLNNKRSQESADEEREEFFDKEHRKAAARRPRTIRFSIAELSHVYLRRYRLRDSSMELFFIPSGGSGLPGSPTLPAVSFFLDFGPGRPGNVRRDSAANAILKRAPVQCAKQWPEKSGHFLHDQLNKITLSWVEGSLSNFDYLLHLNLLAGRSFNDLCQYPVMPWVLNNYTSEDIPDLTQIKNFRDLTRPMGALNQDRLDDFIERFETFQDPTIPPFMYGSHYSTSAGVVMHFLIRLHPFASLHRQLQNGHFDVADRLFSSVPRTWDMCTGSSAAEVKELIPEWYCDPAFLKNSNNFKLGTSQDGELIDDAQLPPWADGSPEKFVEVLRCSLESDICSEMLPSWIDLIFGYKQQGPEAIKANNVFFYLTYYGSVDVASIEDEGLRAATELQIAHFGQCPMQLFWRRHLLKFKHGSLHHKLRFTHMLGLYRLDIDKNKQMIMDDIETTASSRGSMLWGWKGKRYPYVLPFATAPISHWVHLAAPPPGPHAPLVAVRFSGTDRILAVDSRGIFHLFRYVWKSEDLPFVQEDTEEEEQQKEGEKQEEEQLDDKTGSSRTKDKQLIQDEERQEKHSNSSETSKNDKKDLKPEVGCFVAQRELPHFRSIPRLPYLGNGQTTNNSNAHNRNARPQDVAVAISRTVFSSQTLLLILSDGDGKGALAMQFVDPAKGAIKGQAILPCVHSDRIVAIAMDTIGSGSEGGGVGGDLALVGSNDGNATLWRFVSSHYLPMRPRLRMRGHYGRPIRSVAINSALNLCVTVSGGRCCLFNIGNGSLLRSFPPPNKSTTEGKKDHSLETVFAATQAVCLSMQGFVILVCQTTNANKQTATAAIISLEMFSLEGEHCGSHTLKSFRGLPHKILPISSGRAIMVCAGRGVTIHKVSVINSLHVLDDWRTTEDYSTNTPPAAFDIDLGPTLMRPVVAVAGCSGGALRLHALPGIGAWSEDNKKNAVTTAVGNALARPAQKMFKNAVGSVKGIGYRVVGFGKEIAREASSDVKERGVGGFLGGVMFRKGNR